MLDSVITALLTLAGPMVYVLTLMGIVGVVAILRWGINHGVDNIAALFGRGPKARR